MKKIIFSILATLTAIFSIAQNYEAANWRVLLLDNPQQLTIAAPPAAAQSKTELQLIKQQGKPDEKAVARIKYWDAGAPSYRWNQIAIKLVTYDKTEILLRTPAAWMDLAVYDATILAWKEKIKYKRKRPQQTDPSIRPVINVPLTYSYPCEHTVTAAAAATVLAYFYPDKADSILQLAHAASQSRIDAGVQYPSDADAGWKLGEQVALQIIEKAKQDGSAKTWNGTVNKDPKKWTGPYAMGIKLTEFTPMIMRSADQFRPVPPPDFEQEMKDLKNFKQNSRSRFLAHYWANSGPEVWNDLVSQKMFEYHIDDDAPAAARIYATLNTAFHEMTISVFDAKYTYWGIRPVQYDTTYKSMITTPPFPGYPSGHAAGAGTSAAVLEYFFPADAKQFRQMAQDCADSRFYAGIHFRTDNETGLRMGETLGKYVAEAFMKQ
jgi:membrane-associated phospholipid phosphatase